MRRRFLFFSVCFLGALDAAAFTGADLNNRPANSWIAYPYTQLSRVIPDPIAYPNIQGASGVSAVINAWGGAAFDSKRNRLVVWGGGHNDYWGNEVYVFDIDSLRWERIKDPTPNPNLCNQVNSDGTPNTRHTYSGLAYITHADRFFACGGALACPPGSCGANKAWTFDFTTLKWKDQNPSGSAPKTQCEDNCAYDPLTKKVYYFDDVGLASFDYDANQWKTLTSDGRYNHTSVVDPKRHLLFNIGHGSVLVYDLTQPTLTGQSWTTTGGSAFISGGALGLAYDSKTDQIVGWNGGSVYALNIDTKVWTATTAANAPQPNSNGTFGRWQYVPKYNIFISVNRIGDNTYFYKLSAGAGTVGEESAYGRQGQRQGAEGKRQIEVSPNPVRGTVVIEVPGLGLMGRAPEISVYDLTGRSVTRLVSNNVRSVRYKWQTRNIPAGVYFLRTSIEGREYSKKILVVR